ncbi:hypothetical protein MCNF_07430 [Mycolicibacterium confluentis]|uniref:DUF559 domain-containing protein n=2 Tax=Mycolicibacterium confluentis TaxID=28047 RepID=A0A7I7XSD5_9MYCO|nr:hypothetical protein MCNF_07430 [Mycolicibacterium confluentis]
MRARTGPSAFGAETADSANSVPRFRTPSSLGTSGTGRFIDPAGMNPEMRPFIGSEALVNGRLTAYELRARFRALYPDVYLPKEVVPSLRQRTIAAWLWSHRQGVIAGRAAAALHGSKWVDDNAEIDLVWPNSRSARGIRTCDARLRRSEYQSVEGMLITSPARTAFDMGRQLSVDEGVAQLDALGNVTRLPRAAVEAVAANHPGSRRIRRLREALDLYDPGAQSPKETWLRLLAIRAGYPRPRTQIPVDCGYRRFYLDMGWDKPKIALEYDGAHHRQSVREVRYDIERMELLTARGWIVIRVIAGTRPDDVLERLRRAWRQRDCGDCESEAG